MEMIMDHAWPWLRRSFDMIESSRTSCNTLLNLQQRKQTNVSLESIWSNQGVSVSSIQPTVYICVKLLTYLYILLYQIKIIKSWRISETPLIRVKPASQSLFWLPAMCVGDQVIFQPIISTCGNIHTCNRCPELSVKAHTHTHPHTHTHVQVNFLPLFTCWRL